MTSITGELLVEQRRKIEKVIEDNNLSKAEEALLRGQSLILKFVNEDHAKTKEMYEDFTKRKVGRARALTLADGVILIVASSILQVVLSLLGGG